MKKYIILIIIILPSYIFSQGLEDVLRFSRVDYYSTARSMGVSGAFGAMGGDFAAISSNPATLGNFWKSEFNISMGFDNSNTDASFDEKMKNSIGNKFSFNNVGFITNSKIRSGNWMSVNFAIGLNKVANYNKYFDVSGITSGSILEDSRLVSGVAYDPYNDIPIEKQQIIDESGSLSEMVFALGGNYKNRLLFGVSVGVPFLNFSSDRKYSETAPPELYDDDEFYFRNLDYDQYYSTVGVGINIKAGAIYMTPNNYRFGLSVHSPTSLKLKDDYSEDFTVASRNFIFDTLSYSGYFDYKLSTPWRLIGSLGKVFKGSDISGFVNFDAEYVGYANARYNFRKYSSDEYDLENEKTQNRAIREGLRSAFNFKLGGELAYAKYRIRLGGSLSDSPFSVNEDYNPDITYSFGLGYRSDNYYFDLGYIGIDRSYSFYPYQADDIERTPEVDIDNHINKFTATVGFKF